MKREKKQNLIQVDTVEIFYFNIYCEMKAVRIMRIRWKLYEGSGGGITWQPAGIKCRYEEQECMAR